MVQVIGQVGSLKELSRQLNLRGINQFNSIRQINDFISDYQSKRDKILNHYSEEVENRISALNAKIIDYKQSIEKTQFETKLSLDSKKRELELEKENIGTNPTQSLLNKIRNLLKTIKVNRKLNFLVTNYHKLIKNSTKIYDQCLRNFLVDFNYLMVNKDQVIAKRSEKELNELAFIKNSIEELRPLIAGSIGEDLVVKEILKLNGDYILFNDLRINLNPPIYYNHSLDRIHSVQIDHLLVSKSGIFLLETKNWSRNSINAEYLRSPIEQINRTGYALYFLLNGGHGRPGIHLNGHHWGDTKIPVKNIVVMINGKPTVKFKNVSVKSLNELNSYISYFDQCFNDYEYSKVTDYLMKLHSLSK